MQEGLRRGLWKERVARVEEIPARPLKSSAGRRPGRRKWSCDCCAASRWIRSPGKSPCQSTSLNSGGIGPWPGWMPVSRSARTIRSPANSMTPIRALANWSWKSRSCKRKDGQSALWSAGGRRDELRDLRRRWQTLRIGAGLPGARLSPLDALRAAGPGIGQGDAVALDAARAEADGARCRAPGGHPRRSGSLALYRRGAPQGVGAAAHRARHARRSRSGAALDARAWLALASSPPPGQPGVARRLAANNPPERNVGHGRYPDRDGG